VVEVNGFEMEITPSEHMAFFIYADRPGIVGIVGQILGKRDINIAGMQVCPDPKGGRGRALMVLTVESALTPALLDEITEAVGAEVGRSVDLDGR
jgi:D-3-phosphoglycerate dehydrogenase